MFSLKGEADGKKSLLDLPVFKMQIELAKNTEA